MSVERFTRCVGTLLVAAVAAPCGVAAQSASMLVEADVADVRIVTRTVRPLSFGEVQPGRPVTIDPRASPEAGMFEIAAAAGTEFRVAMQMPAQLQSDETGAVMPMRGGTVSGCAVGASDGDCADVANDAVWETGVVATQVADGSAVRLRLGGTVQPPDAQPPGRYRGTVVASLAFTAN